MSMFFFLILFRLQVLSGNVSQADWDRLQYYSRRVKTFIVVYIDRGPQVHPSTYVRITELQTSTLFPSLRHLECYFGDKTIPPITLFLSPRLDSLSFHYIGGFENTAVEPFLATLSSSPQMLTRIVLNSGRMSGEFLKNSFVHFKQLRTLQFSDAVLMTDFSLWEVLGTLPSLKNLTLAAEDPESHPAHAPVNSNSRSGGLRYFEALESLRVLGSFFFIQHLLGFIDSSCLKSITVDPVIDHVHNDSEREHDLGDLLIPSMTIVATKWSQSLTDLTIYSTPETNATGFTHRNSKFLTLLTNLCEIRRFFISGWAMENNDDAVRRLAKSWSKLKHFVWGVRQLPLNQTFVSLSTLRVFADHCPELQYLHIPFDISTIPPFDNISSKKSPGHNLEVLVLDDFGGDHPLVQTMLDCQIQVARHLDFVFPYLKTINVGNANWSGIRNLVKIYQDARRFGGQ